MVLALVVVAAAAGLLYVGYKYGARAKAEAVSFEQGAKEYYAQAHSRVSAKLSAVKAEVSKIEEEAKVEEKAVVARLKVLL